MVSGCGGATLLHGGAVSPHGGALTGGVLTGVALTGCWGAGGVLATGGVGGRCAWWAGGVLTG
ncbi:hypothetical protein GCM10027259_23150 [Micromonospora palomenae]